MKPITGTIYSDGTLIDGRKAAPRYFVVTHAPVKQDKAFAVMFTLETGEQVFKIWRPIPSKDGNYLSYTNYSSKELAEKAATQFNRRHDL